MIGVPEPVRFKIIILQCQTVNWYYHHWGGFSNSGSVIGNKRNLRQAILKTNLSEVQLNGEIWRFWTYQFLHANIEHILSNILVSSLLGITLEMVHGPLSEDFKSLLLARWLVKGSTSNQHWLKSIPRIATLYTVGVILGACYHLIITPNSYLVGASGGCYALIGAQVANFLLNFKEYTIWSKVIRAAVLGCFLLADIAMAVIR